MAVPVIPVFPYNAGGDARGATECNATARRLKTTLRPDDVQNVQAAKTLDDKDQVVILTLGTYTVTLPAVGKFRTITFFVGFGTSGTITVSGSGGFSQTLDALGELITVYDDNGTWVVVADTRTLLGGGDIVIDGTLTAKPPVTRATADVNYTVLTTDRVILISTTGAGNRTITFGAGVDGQEVEVIMTAATTGDYASVGIDDSGAQVLWNAAGEVARFRYALTEDKWYLVSIARATQV